MSRCGLFAQCWRGRPGTWSAPLESRSKPLPPRSALRPVGLQRGRRRSQSFAGDAPRMLPGGAC
eukprot:11756335-Heterocapsa_arctica.AAC.1